MAYPGPVFPDNRRRGQDYPYSKKTAVQWGGYNHRKAAGDMEWYDDCNMTSDYAPLLASREPMLYGLKLDAEKYHGVCGGDDLWIATGTSVRHKVNADEYTTVLTGLTDTDKLMCTFGNRLIVWPDKVAYNTTSAQREALEANYNNRGSDMVKFFSGTYEGEPATANSIQILGDAVGFNAGDAITISGCVTHPENNMSLIIRDISRLNVEGMHFTTFRFYDNSFVIGDGQVEIVGDDGSVAEVDGYYESGSAENPVTISRTAPDLDILFVHENRLWGAKGDTIYASALGDPFNWNVFDGLGTDSWTVDVLDDGDFSGGCSFLGYPVFFKDNHIYKVYGNIPSDFQLVQSADLGVEPGSGKSLAIAGEKLYYLSRAGVMVYSGSLPQIISQPLGDVKYHDGIAGTDGVKYWITLRRLDNSRDMFVYDTQTGIWHKQICYDLHHDNESRIFTGYAWHGNGLYAIYDEMTGGDDLPVYATYVYFIGHDSDAPIVPGESFPTYADNPVSWYVESADFTEYSPQRKWIGPRIEIRAELETGASFSVYVRHNNVQSWQLIGGPFSDAGKHSFVCSKIPARSDFYKIRIVGTGRVWIYSIAPMTEQGSADFGYNGG